MHTRRDIAPRKHLSEANLALMGIPKSFFDAEISDYVGDDELRDLVARYIDNIHDMYDDCVNLTLYGSNGSGKSFITGIILKNAYRKYYSTQRITVSKFVTLTFKGMNKTDKEFDFLERVRNVEFLVLDELGKETTTEKGNELSVIDELMKHREEQGLPVIISTNLSLEDIKKRYGNTLRSLLDQSICLEMTGEDMRAEVFSKRRGVSILLGEE